MKTKKKTLKKYLYIIPFFWLISFSFFGTMQLSLADCEEGFQEEAGVCMPTTTGLADPSATDPHPITTVAITVMNWILGIFGVLAVIAFVIAGIIYLTSAGDEDRAQQAKRAMTYSIIGVIVALMGLVIIYAVDNMLRNQASF